MAKRILNENSNRCRKVKRVLFGDTTGRIRTFAILSFENPLGIKDSTEEEFKAKFYKYTNEKKKYNLDKLQELTSQSLADRILRTGDTALRYGAFDYAPLKCVLESGARSIIIFNLSQKDAECVACCFGQESYFFGIVSLDPNIEPSLVSYYKSINACQSYKLIEMSQTVKYVENVNEFFSKFGLKLKINLQEFGDAITPVKNHAMFEESFTRPTFMLRASARRNART